MQLKTKEVADGLHTGKEVWICDLRWNDFNNKPIRDITPKKVIVRPISETKKRVYYSEIFFSEIKNDKVVSSSVIGLFDNTGYRSYTGVPLNVFTTEAECIKNYKKLAHEAYKSFLEWKQIQLNYINGVEEKILKITNPLP